MDIGLALETISDKIIKHFDLNLSDGKGQILLFDKQFGEIVFSSIRLPDELTHSFSSIQVLNESELIKYLNFFKEFLKFLLSTDLYDYIKGYDIRLAYSNAKIEL